MTNKERLNLIERAVLKWIDFSYAENSLPKYELATIEAFWDDVNTLVNDKIDSGYFEET